MRTAANCATWWHAGVFPAYVRLPHPAYIPGSPSDVEITWREQARARGVRLDPSVSWDDLDAEADRILQRPVVGTSPEHIMAAVLDLLHVEGGDLVSGFRDVLPVPDIPLRDDFWLDAPGRHHCGLVDRQAVDVATAAGRSPNLLWPAGDDAIAPPWLVVVEIDDRSTIVACSREIADRLLGLPGIESWELRDPVTT
ncbi:hypothetical protein GIS00_17410 [Nakamurella sp. YIM 132087]|uniref:Uncharacterized protein n=1 Tax=Nakamurella alba TaxID=2665158 RepID=A0A7K1FSB1_9ACTN|nr:hypothetical protein [Nakamurella alba]MTD15714.1 hypothetical protein [Nakamurella alba]